MEATGVRRTDKSKDLYLPSTKKQSSPQTKSVAKKTDEPPVKTAVSSGGHIADSKIQNQSHQLMDKIQQKTFSEKDATMKPPVARVANAGFAATFGSKAISGLAGDAGAKGGFGVLCYGLGLGINAADFYEWIKESRLGHELENSYKDANTEYTKAVSKLERTMDAYNLVMDRLNANPKGRSDTRRDQPGLELLEAEMKKDIMAVNRKFLIMRSVQVRDLLGKEMTADALKGGIISGAGVVRNAGKLAQSGAQLAKLAEVADVSELALTAVPAFAGMELGGALLGAPVFTTLGIMETMSAIDRKALVKKVVEYVKTHEKCDPELKNIAELIRKSQDPESHIFRAVNNLVFLSMSVSEGVAGAAALAAILGATGAATVSGVATPVGLALGGTAALSLLGYIVYDIYKGEMEDQKTLDWADASNGKGAKFNEMMLQKKQACIQSGKPWDRAGFNRAKAEVLEQANGELVKRIPAMAFRILINRLKSEAAEPGKSRTADFLVQLGFDRREIDAIIASDKTSEAAAIALICKKLNVSRDKYQDSLDIVRGK